MSFTDSSLYSEDWEPAAEDLLHGQWLVLRRGKKNFAGAHFA